MPILTSILAGVSLTVCMPMGDLDAATALGILGRFALWSPLIVGATLLLRQLRVPIGWHRLFRRGALLVWAASAVWFVEFILITPPVATWLGVECAQAWSLFDVAVPAVGLACVWLVTAVAVERLGVERYEVGA